MTTYQDLLAIDARLSAAGFPALSPWWLGQLRRFYEHPTATSFVARVGRGGAKSTTLCKVALAETLAGDWHVPPGELHFFGFVSASKDEASLRLRLLEAYLRALGIRFTRSGDTIELADMPRGFRVLACQIGSVSGFRCFGYALDELAKWESADHAANPANEVDASAAAMTVTHPGARRFKVSSPFGLEDHHYHLMARGDTPDQVVCEAPSWVANPSITEEQTHQLEPDTRTWSREYLAVPQAVTSSAFEPLAIEGAFRPIPDGYVPGPAFGVIDFSSGRSDAATWGLVRWYRVPRTGPRPRMVTRRTYQRLVGSYFKGDSRYEEWTPGLADLDKDGLPLTGTYREWQEPALDDSGHPIMIPQVARPPLLALESIDAVEGAFWKSLPADQLVAKMAQAFRDRTRSVYGDQREDYLLISEFAKHNIGFTPIKWDNDNKRLAVERIRRSLHDGRLVFPDSPPCEKLRSQLYSFQEKLTPSGSLTYAGRGRTHDDFVALVLTMTMAPALTWVETSQADLEADTRALAPFTSRWSGMPGQGF